MFGLSHAQVAQKMGRSREYVSNSIRLLGLPSHMLDALKIAKLSEGHARTLLMLNDRKEEQEVVFQEILLKKLSVREVERIARKIATDKIRKRNPDDFDVHLIEIEKQFTETLGTRVQIQKTDFGGKLTIDYFSTDDLEILLQRVRQEQHTSTSANTATTLSEATPLIIAQEAESASDIPQPSAAMSVSEPYETSIGMPEALFIPEVSDDVASDTLIEPEEDESDLYSINSFTV
jgi:HTH domain found in ParB protein